MQTSLEWLNDSLAGWKANPSPPVWPALGQHGITAVPKKPIPAFKPGRSLKDAVN
jgi:hypothetical protein